ncbi:hypothetical protein BKA70DRAFT_1262992 [Coprinopsis sp. MPI-PUGE-AT-0042]|nr:hypothetical protein BKA70DRAFT_1262992 [Coprinopsis sp. MPI-PUGE-AT-0042]
MADFARFRFGIEGIECISGCRLSDEDVGVAVVTVEELDDEGTGTVFDLPRVACLSFSLSRSRASLIRSLSRSLSSLASRESRYSLYSRSFVLSLSLSLLLRMISASIELAATVVDGEVGEKGELIGDRADVVVEVVVGNSGAAMDAVRDNDTPTVDAAREGIGIQSNAVFKRPCTEVKLLFRGNGQVFDTLAVLLMDVVNNGGGFAFVFRTTELAADRDLLRAMCGVVLVVSAPSGLSSSPGTSSVAVLVSEGPDVLFPENMFDSDEIRRVKRLELDGVVCGSLIAEAEVDVRLIFGLGGASCVFPKSAVVASRGCGRSNGIPIKVGIDPVEGSTNVADDDDDGSDSSPTTLSSFSSSHSSREPGSS